MTTWHKDEPPEDVVDFFLTSTDFGPHEFSNYLAGCGKSHDFTVRDRIG
jgi:hypothetical protein